MSKKVLEYVFPKKEDAEKVLSALRQVLNAYSCATLSDFKELSGLETTYLDQKVGWSTLDNIEIIEVPEGFRLVFTLLEQIP